MNLTGVLLAAGRSRRFGSDKLLHPLSNGMPMVAVAAANLRPVCDRLIVVVRPDNETLVTVLAANGYETLVCAEADAGMGRSLAAGIHASSDADGWVVALADMPFVQTSSHAEVATALRAGAALAATEFRGMRGHPVGFAACWREQLISLSGDQGGRSILDAHHKVIQLCQVDDPGVLRDIDEPADLAPESQKPSANQRRNLG